MKTTHKQLIAARTILERYRFYPHEGELLNELRAPCRVPGSIRADMRRLAGIYRTVVRS